MNQTLQLTSVTIHIWIYLWHSAIVSLSHSIVCLMLSYRPTRRSSDMQASIVHSRKVQLQLELLSYDTCFSYWNGWHCFSVTKTIDNKGYYDCLGNYTIRRLYEENENFRYFMKLKFDFFLLNWLNRFEADQKSDKLIKKWGKIKYKHSCHSL